MQTSMDDTKRSEKLRQKLKPFHDTKVKAKHRIHALQQFITAASYPEVVRFLREHDHLVMTLWVEVWLRQLDKLEAARQKNERLSWQAKEVVEVQNHLLLLRWVILVRGEKIQTGWHQTTIGSVVQLLLAYEQHPKWRQEGLRLCLLWICAKRSCSQDLMDLLRNCLILNPFKYLLKADSFDHNQVWIVFGKPYTNAARILMQPSQPPTADEARQLIQEWVDTLCCVANGDPMVLLREENEKNGIYLEKQSAVLELLMDTFVDALWKPLFPNAHAPSTSPGSSSCLLFEKTPPSLLQPLITFLIQATNSPDSPFLRHVFPKYVLCCKEILEQSISCDAIEVIQESLLLIRVWCWCAKGLPSVVSAFATLLPRENPANLIAEISSEYSDEELFIRFLIKLLCNIYSGLSDKTATQDLFVIFLDSLTTFRGLLLSEKSCETWHVVMESLLYIHKCLILNPCPPMIQADFVVWANETRIYLVETMAMTWLQARLDDISWQYLCDSWSESLKFPGVSFITLKTWTKWLRFLSEKVVHVGCGLSIPMNAASSSPSKYESTDSGGTPQRRRFQTVPTPDVALSPLPPSDRLRSRSGRSSSFQFSTLSRTTSSCYNRDDSTLGRKENPQMPPVFLPVTEQSEEPTSNFPFISSQLPEMQRLISSIERNWEFKGDDTANWIWHQWLVVLGNCNLVSDVRLQHEWISGVIEIFDYFCHVRKLQDWKPKFTLPLYVTLPWMIQAANLSDHYNEGRVVAYGCLCRMICRKPHDRLDDPNFPIQSLSAVYRTLLKGLYVISDISVSAAILSNAYDIWTLNLPGSTCLVPAFLAAAKNLLLPKESFSQSPKPPDKGTKAVSATSVVSLDVKYKVVQTICSMVCWAKWMHHQGHTVSFSSSWKSKEFYDSNVPEANVDQISWMMIRDELCQILFSLDSEEKIRPTSLVIQSLILSAIALMTFYEFKSIEYSYDQSLIDSSVTCLLEHLNATTRQPEKVVIVMECLNLVKHDTIPPEYLLRVIIEKIVGSIAEYLHLDANLDDTIRTEIICSLLHGLLEWMLIMPAELISDHEFMQKIFDVIESALEDYQFREETLSTSQTDTSSVKNGSLNNSSENLLNSNRLKPESRIQETANFVTAQFLQHYLTFPTRAGPAKTSTSCTNGSLEEQPQLRPEFLSSFGKNRLISFHSFPDQPSEGRLIIRDGTGKYAWKMRPLDESTFLPLSEKFYIRRQDAQYPQSKAGDQEFHENQDPLALLLEDLSVNYADWLPLNCQSWNQPPAIELPSISFDFDMFDLGNIEENSDKHSLHGFELSAPVADQEKRTWDVMRHFLSEIGWWKREESTFQATGYQPNSGFWRDLKGLDKQWSRECAKIGIIFVGRGQEEESEIMSNDEAQTSELYKSFVNSLGWSIDVKNHPGFLGGLEKNGATGNSAVYWSNQLLEIIWHDTTRIKDESISIDALAKPTKNQSEAPVDGGESRSQADIPSSNLDTALENKALYNSDLKKKHDAVKKKRHVGNDAVHVVWDEHDRWLNIKRLKTDFGNVQLAIRPMFSLSKKSDKQQIYAVFQNQEDSSLLYAPFLPIALVPASILPSLIRMTCIHANRHVQMKTAHVSLGTSRDSRAEVFEKRREGIGLLVQRYGQELASLSWVLAPK